jgi:hypothetical protein
MMRVEGDLHVMSTKQAQCGHVQSHDCWCEPTRIYLTVVHGLPGVTRVIEHNDDATEHRLVIINRRERDRQKPCADFHTDHDWITRVLTPPWQPSLLPPHDPNERNL